jgi:hypothetical protein
VRSYRLRRSSQVSAAADDEPTDELIGVLACNCGVVGMDLLAAKVLLLRKFGSMLIALRRSIPNAPKSMYTVVNPVASHTLEARSVLLVPCTRQCGASSSSMNGSMCHVTNLRLTPFCSDMLLLVANRPLPSAWFMSHGNAVEVWKESQLLFESWKLRPAEEGEEQDKVAQTTAGAGDEDDDSSVLLVDLVEVAVSLMKEISRLGKQAAQYRRSVNHV